MALAGTADEVARFQAAMTPTRIATVSFGAILIVSAYLRFHGLGDDSVWRDEAVTWLQAHGSFIDIIVATAGDNYPPLHNLFVAASLHLFGDNQWALRAPSALFGVASVAAIYWVGTMVGGRMVGLLAALLLTFSPFHIWYSQEARAYALMTLFATVFAGAALSLGRKETLVRVVAALLAAVGLLYTHPYGVFLWLSISAAVLALILLRPSPDGASPAVWLLSQGAAAIAFVPWALILLGRARSIEQHGLSWLAYPTPTFVFRQVSALASGPLVLALLTLALLVVFLPFRSPRGDESRPSAISAERWVLVAWMAGPIVIGLGISLVGTPLFHQRYIIGSLPPLILLASIGVLRFVGGRQAIAAAIVFGIAISALGFAYGRPSAREDWRSAYAYITANLPADGCVLVPTSGHVAGLTYYMSRPLPCLAVGTEEARRIESNFVMVVIAAGASPRILEELPAPAWRHGQPVRFRGIVVVAFQRN